MSLRNLSVRLTKNVWHILQNFRGRTFNILDVSNAGVRTRQAVLPRAAKTVDVSWGHHVRNVLIGNLIPKNTGELRKQFIKRLFYGDSKPLFALIGFALASEMEAEDETEERRCNLIRDTVSNYMLRFHCKTELDYKYNNLTLESLEIGNILSKGCSGVICDVKVNETSYDTEMNTFNRDIPGKPLVLKIMYNYDIESTSPAILKAMYRETVPAQVCHINNLDQNYSFPTALPCLPSHPNIVEMYHAFTDRTPMLPRSMDVYPDALPTRFNPNGLGRNMTLFLLMKKYQYTLKEYIADTQPCSQTSMILFTQLLEGIVHMNRRGMAHRDLKSDNLLVDDVDLGDGYKVPLLVITDFGCCLADIGKSLQVLYQSDSFDKGGNMNLMAPEILSMRPGFTSVLDYRKSDMWAAAAIAYEIFGEENPFSPKNYAEKDKMLYSMNYKDADIPNMHSSVPKIIRHLIKNLLSRNPDNRVSPEVAANICQLHRLAPSCWFTDVIQPDLKTISAWLLDMTTKILLEQSKQFNGINPEYSLITCFLARLDLYYVETAVMWIRNHYSLECS